MRKENLPLIIILIVSIVICIVFAALFVFPKDHSSIALEPYDNESAVSQTHHWNINTPAITDMESDTTIPSSTVSDSEEVIDNTPTPVFCLQLDDESELIKKVQEQLIKLKYLRTEATGFFGKKTESAVKKFQSNNSLEDTGIIDQQTYDMLFSESAKECKLLLSGVIIGVDPGHQRHSNRELEPVAPNSSVMKKKVSSGTAGAYSHIPEYQVNMAVGLILRDLLEEQGATVIMTHTDVDVNISNVERAQMFNKYKTDYAIRLHCNGSENHDVNGAFMLVPPRSFPHFSDCERAAKLVIDHYCKETGIKNLGLTYRDDQTGFNWCERMIINIEMGHMTNKEEDYKLTNADFQKKMAMGIFNGIMAYYD